MLALLVFTISVWGMVDNWTKEKKKDGEEQTWLYLNFLRLSWVQAVKCLDLFFSLVQPVRTLEQLIDRRGKPAAIRIDNGTEFTSADFTDWCKKEDVQIHYTQTGKPMQNGFIERFNGICRREILDAYLFFDLEKVRSLTSQWMEEYNNRRPHEALGNLT